MMAVAIDPETGSPRAEPQRLFLLPEAGGEAGPLVSRGGFDVAPDGQSFFLTQEREAAVRALTPEINRFMYIQNWPKLYAVGGR